MNPSLENIESKTAIAIFVNKIVCKSVLTENEENCLVTVLENQDLTQPLIEKLLIWSINNDRLDHVKRILGIPEADLCFDNNKAILTAFDDGHYDIFKLLLQDARIDPSLNDNYLLMEASRGNIELVRLLLADIRTDPNAQKKKAFDHGFYNVTILKELIFNDRTDLEFLAAWLLAEVAIAGNKNAHVIKILLANPKLCLRRRLFK